MQVYDLPMETILRWHWNDPLLRHLTNTILRLTPESRGRALDVGTGLGRAAVALARRGWQVDALDPQAAVIERAREIAREFNVAVNYFVADFGQPDARFPDETYDLVVCSEVLEHIENWQAITQNIRRVLKRGGTLILTVPNDPAQFSILDSYAGHLRRYRWDELARAFDGLEIHQAFTVGFPFTRTLHWLYTRIVQPLVLREHRPDKMWKSGSAYSTIGAQVFYLAARADDLFNSLKRGTTWIVQARKP
jgi:SAM-dependent methyltransferase